MEFKVFNLQTAAPFDDTEIYRTYTYWFYRQFPSGNEFPGFSGNDRACTNSRYQAVFLRPRGLGMRIPARMNFRESLWWETNIKQWPKHDWFTFHISSCKVIQTLFLVPITASIRMWTKGSESLYWKGLAYKANGNCAWVDVLPFHWLLLHYFMQKNWFTEPFNTPDHSFLQLSYSVPDR